MQPEKSFDELLSDLQNGDKDIRQSVVFALGRLVDARVPQALITATSDTDDYVRECAAISIGMRFSPHLGIRELCLQEIPVFMEAMSPLVNDSAPWVREATVKSLGEIRDKKAVPMLIAALQDGFSDVRWSAVCSLGKIGDERAIEPLKDVLQDTGKLTPRRMEILVGSTVGEMAEWALKQIAKAQSLT